MSTDTASLTVPFSVIPAKPVHWLHKGFVPRRHVTLVVGAGGTSKGIDVLDYAARMTRHAPMPGEAEPSYDAPMDVVVILPEDDPNEAVAGRLAGAEAVCDRVHNLTILPDGQPFCVQRDIPLIATAIHEIEDPVRTPLPADGQPRKVGMVIIDPLLAVSENDLRSRGQARPIMEALEAVARKYNLVIFLTHHTNANGQAASSRAITETARNVLTLARLPKSDADDPVRVQTVSKTNIGITGLAMRYTLTGPLDAPHVAWAVEQPPGDVKRGYDIAESDSPTQPLPPVPPGGKHEAGAAEAGHFRASKLVQSTIAHGGKPVVLGSDFATRELARIRCHQDASQTLAWAPTPVPGMEGAKTVNGNGTVYYSVQDQDVAAQHQVAA